MPLDRLLKFPKAPAPNDDPASIKGNLPLEWKQLLVNILHFHSGDYPGSRVFGNEQSTGLKLVEVSVGNRHGGLSETEKLDDLEATTVCELVVDHGELSTIVVSK